MLKQIFKSKSDDKENLLKLYKKKIKQLSKMTDVEPIQKKKFLYPQLSQLQDLNPYYFTFHAQLHYNGLHKDRGIN